MGYDALEIGKSRGSDWDQRLGSATQVRGRRDERREEETRLSALAGTDRSSSRGVDAGLSCLETPPLPTPVILHTSPRETPPPLIRRSACASRASVSPSPQQGRAHAGPACAHVAPRQGPGSPHRQGRPAADRTQLVGAGRRRLSGPSPSRAGRLEGALGIRVMLVPQLGPPSDPCGH